MDNVDVVVVGAGATGLMLANELAICGVSSVVLDREIGRLSHSKALALQPRTAEVFDLRGLIDGARERPLASVNGHFAALPVPLTYTGWSTPYPYMVAITQSRVEALLEERAAANGVTIRREHELTTMTQDETGVTATVDTPHGQRQVRGRYLVGCDGGRSVVRKLAGVKFSGTPAVRFSVIADVVLKETGAELDSTWDDLGKTFGHRTANGQVVSLLPLGEPNLHRLGYQDPPISAETRDAPVPTERLEEMLQSRYGDKAQIAEVRWVSCFGDASRQAEQYRVDRVLLAGDAAHIHSPAGGQGLNLGVQDAMNLGWKLAAQVKGWAPEGLLDTYQLERHPVAAQVLHNTRAQSLFLDTTSAADERVEAMRELFTTLMSIPDVNRHLAGMVSGLGIHYPIAGQHHHLAGARLPDTEVTANGKPQRTSVLLRTGKGLLLTNADSDATTATQWADRVDVVRTPQMTVSGSVVGALLVRPDGYICWAQTTQDAARLSGEVPAPAELVDSLIQWFGQPVR
ncbi:FAD-dependent monooxygenase [Streptomyces sp. NPDC005374]|uniref:FAD-dependent monooxygenase n=1 Tax=Streptomyces sp. NPDC005374 TaxID=3364713 RepID=UPI00369EC8D8